MMRKIDQSLNKIIKIYIASIFLFLTFLFYFIFVQNSNNRYFTGLDESMATFDTIFSSFEEPIFRFIHHLDSLVGDRIEEFRFSSSELYNLLENDELASNKMHAILDKHGDVLEGDLNPYIDPELLASFLSKIHERAMTQELSPYYLIDSISGGIGLIYPLIDETNGQKVIGFILYHDVQDFFVNILTKHEVLISALLREVDSWHLESEWGDYQTGSLYVGDTKMCSEINCEHEYKSYFVDADIPLWSFSLKLVPLEPESMKYTRIWRYIFLLVFLLYNALIYYLLRIHRVKLKRNEAKLLDINSVFQMLPNSVCMVDTETQCVINCNTFFASYLGYRIEGIVGMNVLEFVHAASWSSIVGFLDKVPYIIDYEINMLTDEKQHKRVFFSVRKIDYDNGQSYLISMSDYNARSEKETFLTHLANIDSLTTLQNRRAFLQKMEQIFNSLTETEEYVFLSLDIDYFKSFNDKYGHLAGDTILKEFSLLLKRTVREGVDVVGRLGGEEFAIILQKTNFLVGKLVAERLRVSIENLEIYHEGQKLHVTTSIGLVSVRKDDFADLRGLLSYADDKLYEAKDAGRNRVVY